MRKALELFSAAEREGVIERFCIGGAVAAIYYISVFETEDLDLFVVLPAGVPVLAPLGPLYEYLRKHGAVEDGPYVRVGGTPVQVLPAYSRLVELALKEAQWVDYDGVRVRMPLPEHLAAIMVETGRRKDRERFLRMLEEAQLDPRRLAETCADAGLSERYQQWMED